MTFRLGGQRSMETKSYRTVGQVPADAMGAAASYLAREWGASLTLGYAGLVSSADYGPAAPRGGSEDETANPRTLYVFQCQAGDGSRWLIWADRWGNVGDFSPTTEQTLGLTLDVEVSRGEQGARRWLA